MEKHDETGRQASRRLAVALALVAFGGGCGGGDPGDATPDGGPGETSDGNPLDPGGDGPALLELTCPPLAMPPAAGTVFVDAAAAGGDGSKAAPFATVAEALASASRGGVIYVAAGTYRESLRIPDQDLVVYGGFVPGFSDRTDGCATVLEAPNRSLNVLVADVGVTRFGIDGVTVQKGARGLLVEVEGGGEVVPMYTIASSVFADNGTVTEVGGGALLDNASARITGSVFRDNRAAKGAAVALGEGGATIVVERSLFERNIGYSDHGGALYLTPTTGTITRSTFRGNEIGRDAGYGWGGAVIVAKTVNPVSLDFSYNVFTDNLAGVGGAVFIDDGATATMSHDLFYRNRAIRENGIARGAAIYVDGLGGPGTGSHLVADHLTVANNNYGEDGVVSPSRGGDVYLETYSTATFTSSLFWNNGAEPLFGDPTCSISVSYSIAATGCDGTSACTIGAGVFEPAAVNFVDESANDYHEKSTAGHFSRGAWILDEVSSAAIDAADPAESAANEPAPNGTRANVGAFGRTSEASKSP